MTRQRYILLIALLALVALGGIIYQLNNQHNTSPTVTYHTMDGRTVTSEELIGQVSLIKFWATDCVICMRQMPSLVRYHDTYHDQGLVIMAVAMKHDNPSAIQRLIDDRGYPFMVTHDADGSIAQAFGEVRFTPVAFVLDRQGQRVKSFIGDYDSNLLVAEIEQALAQPAQ